MLYRILLITLSLIFFNKESFAQQSHIITGAVTSTADHQAVEGAAVKLKSSGNMTISDYRGMFSIESAALNDTLIISHVSFVTKQIPIRRGMVFPIPVNIEPDLRHLRDITIVSTGYQDIPKERATGSFYKIDQTLFNQQVSTDVLSRLEGMTSALLFDKRDPNDTRLQVRGLSTLYSNSQPLVILDNFPFDGDLNAINPNEVESVTVLKDAAAASIWGARAGNGVIVITTKKGRFNQPISLSLNSNATISTKPSLDDIPFIPSSDYIDLEKTLFDQGYYNTQIQYPTFYPLSPAVDIMARNRAGNLSDADAERQLNSLKTLDVRDDFRKYIYRESLNQQYAVQMTGGNRDISWLFSSGFDRNQTNLKGNDYSRINLRANTTYQPLKNIQIQSSILYTRSQTTNNSTGAYGAGSYRLRSKELYPYAQFADADGNPLSLDKQFGRQYTDTVGGAKLLDWKYYVLNELEEADNRSDNHDLLANLALKYSLTPALSTEIRYQFERGFTDIRNYQNINSYVTRDLINRYTNLNAADPNYRNPVPLGGILDLRNADLIAQSLRAQLNFNKSWSNNHTVFFLAGAETRETKTTTDQHRSYGYDEEFLSFKNVDYINRYQSYDNLDGTLLIPDNTMFSGILNRYVSAFANGSYTLNGKYTVSASARRDASNIFGVDANDRGTPLWSTGLSWDISKEGFYRVPAMPYLKLRATYGYSGNVNQTVSALTVLRYSPASNSVLNLPTASIINSPNPDLRWERVKMINAGLDFASANNRVSGSLEYYLKRSLDLIADQNIDFTSGVGAITANSANMNGSGLDLILNTRNIEGRFNWQTLLLFSNTSYKVTKYLVDEERIGHVSDGSILIPLLNFNPYEVVSFRWAGLDPLTGDPQGYLNGEISKDYWALLSNPISEQIKHGPGLPKYFGNLRNTFSFGKLSATINLSYKFAYFFYKSSINYGSLFSNGIMSTDYVNRWQKPGDEAFTQVPSMIYPTNNARDFFYEMAEVNVLKADHIRLQDIFFSYTLNKSLVNRLPVKDVQLYANLSNMNTILWRANKAGIDPEYPSGLRPSKNISLGLRANF